MQERRSMAESLILRMEQNAEVAPILAFTLEHWLAEFGSGGVVQTPIGEVKMGENQYLKMQHKKRTAQLGMVKPTLANPDVVLEEKSRENAVVNERKTNFVFIKTFVNEAGKKHIHFECVTVSRDKKEVAVSSHVIRLKQLLAKLQAGRVVYTATALNASGQTFAEYTSHTETGAPVL